MPRAAEVKRGDQFDGFFRIRELQERQTRAGKPYLDLQLEDRTGCLPAKVWELPEAVVGAVERGDFVKVRAAGEDYQGAIQLRVHKIRRIAEADRDAGFREEDCVQSTAYDVDLMWEEFRRIAQSCHPVVAGLLLSILDEYAERLRGWPASQRIHHAYVGGLLEHTLSVTKTCIYLASKYEGISRDLLIAGAILHDIGKIEELSPVAGTHYTAEGRLLGHLVLGRDIVREHARRLGNLPGEFLLHLEHLILAHQGMPEWGTVRMPMTPEALLLHYADDIDAKFNVVQTAIRQDRGEEDFTSNQNILRRYLFKLRPLLPALPEEPLAPMPGPGGPVPGDAPAPPEDGTF